MDSQSIEGIAVSQVNAFLYRAKQMLPYINVQDKVPTWDGHILLYRRSGKKTKDIFAQLNVQVKGKIAVELLDNDEITYPIEYKHLKNFQITSTVFFVVVMDESGYKTTLFMATFSPKEIAEIVENSNGKNPDQKKSIHLKKVTSTFFSDEADELYEELKAFNNACVRQQNANSSMQNIDHILMPINPRFLSIFRKFIDDSDVPAERICSVSRYLKGIIDVFLKNIIIEKLEKGIDYDDLYIQQKIDCISKWDKEIGGMFSDAILLGNKVDNIYEDISEQEVHKVIDIAIHIVEELFVKYFLSPMHRFGTEEIQYYFSMLPLNNRIYILEKILKKEPNGMIVDKLSLAYAKIEEYEKAVKVLDEARENGIINEIFYVYQCDNIKLIKQNLKKVQNMNEGKLGEKDMITGIVSGNKVVIGLPTNKSMFDVKKAYDVFRDGFDELYKCYPEFTKLFMYLMQTDFREYEEI